MDRTLRTLLVIGAWSDYRKLMVSALTQSWNILHTQTTEDIPVAFERTRVDMVVLTGCSSQTGWERAAQSAWTANRNIPVLALGSHEQQEALLASLFGIDRGTAWQGPVFTSLSREDLKEDPLKTDLNGSYQASSLTPSLTLLEPYAQSLPEGIRKALNYIDLNYSRSLTLAEVAKTASCSRCHFCKIFKQQVGVPFVAYLSRVRIKKSLDLLSRSELPITDIAFEVGFNDLSHFERVFRTHQKQSPSQYRREAKHPTKTG